jgi:hypothetical protein
MELTHFALGIGAAAAPLVTALSLQYRDDVVGSYLFFGILACLVSAAHRYIAPPVLPDSKWATTTAASTDQAPKAPASVVLQLSICALLFLYVGCEISFASWIAPSIVEKGVMTERDASFMVALFWGCMTGGRLAGAAVLASTTAIDTLLVVQLSVAFISVVFLYTMVHAGTAVLWISTAALGLSLSSIFPMVLSYCSIKGMRLNGAEISRMMVGANLGGMLVPFVMGSFLECFIAVVGMGIAAQLGVVWVMHTLSTRQRLQSEARTSGGQLHGSRASASDSAVREMQPEEMVGVGEKGRGGDAGGGGRAAARAGGAQDGVFDVIARIQSQRNAWGGPAVEGSGAYNSTDVLEDSIYCPIEHSLGLQSRYKDTATNVAGVHIDRPKDKEVVI